MSFNRLVAGGNEDIDAILARDLNEMSLQERESLMEEVHGVGGDVEETPVMVQQNLQQLELELGKITNKLAYEVAANISLPYVTDPKLRLMCLRADKFDPVKAATRLVKMFEWKLQYFGVNTLVRPIFFSDLDDNAQAFLKSGAFQILPSRDQAGRAVMGHFKNIGRTYPYSADSIIRGLLYMFLALTEDEETQKKGHVAIGYYTSLPPEIAIKAIPVLNFCPVRLSAAHFCSNDQAERWFLEVAFRAMVRHDRVKRRVHYGSHSEVQYSLMTFGIPVETFPITYDGELKTANHAKWLARRLAKEYRIQAREEFNGVDLPKQNDVLLGRGSLFQSHHGNVMLRQLVKLRHDDYQAAKVGEKAAISTSIVQAIQQASGRFLERNSDDWWEEIPEKEARKKVSKSFRTLAAQTAKKPAQFAATAVKRRKQEGTTQNSRKQKQRQWQQSAMEDDNHHSDDSSPSSDGESYCCLSAITHATPPGKKTKHSQFSML